eukprot:3941986-Rhodomonas_salina.1
MLSTRVAAVCGCCMLVLAPSTPTPDTPNSNSTNFRAENDKIVWFSVCLKRPWRQKSKRVCVTRIERTQMISAATLPNSSDANRRVFR